MNHRISRLSALFQWACRAALVALLASMVVMAFLLPQDPSLIAHYLPDIVLVAPPSPGRFGLLLLVLALPQLAVLYVLWQLERLFGLYRRGETLTAAPALRIRRIGLGIMVAALMSVLMRPLAGLILTLGNPPGERMLVLLLSSTDIGLVLAGGLMLVVGWIMGEAVRIAEENRGFV